MEQEVTTCDQCGTRKREMNHWFNVSTAFPDALLVLEADDATDTGRPARHICADCLIKEVAQWAEKMDSPQCAGTEQTPWPFTLANIALS